MVIVHGAPSVWVLKGKALMTAVDRSTDVRRPPQRFSVWGPSLKAWPPQEPLTLLQPQLFSAGAGGDGGDGVGWGEQTGGALLGFEAQVCRDASNFQTALPFVCGSAGEGCRGCRRLCW